MNDAHAEIRKALLTEHDVSLFKNVNVGHLRALLAERDALEADAKRYRVLKDLRAQGLVSVAMFSDYEDMEAGLDAIAASGAGKL